jgi:hypothetical protein
VLAIKESKMRVFFLPFLAFGVSFIALIVLQSDIPYVNSKAGIRADDIILDPKKYGGFESWSEGESALPFGWYWAQPNKQGSESVQKITASSEVGSGSASLRLYAKDGERSSVAYIVPSSELYSLLGRTIIVDVSVKAVSKKTKNVCVSIVSVNASRYNDIKKLYCKNTSYWERLTMEYRVPSCSQTLFVLCEADNGAMAYFDDVSIRNSKK